VQRTLARRLRRHPALHVPAPVTALAAERVSVSAWVDGRDVGEVAASGTPEERLTLARALVAFHVGSAREGTLHADPHPGHALLMADGRTAFLDPGATARVDPSRVDLGIAALDALRAQDATAFGNALEALGLLAAERGAEALEAVRGVLGPFADPGEVLLDARAVHDLGVRAVERWREGLALAGAGTPAPGRSVARADARLPRRHGGAARGGGGLARTRPSCGGRRLGCRRVAELAGDQALGPATTCGPRPSSR
jgi:hypothetical protein